MTRLTLLAALAALSGCGIAFGGGQVGKYRARTAVKYEACLENGAGECIERRNVTREEPARRYWGLEIAGAIGRASGLKHPETIQTSVELVGGKGALALGLRAGATFDRALAYANSASLLAVGHLAVTRWIGLHAGAGIQPYTRREDAAAMPEYALVGARALIGVKALFYRQDSLALGLVVEADRTITSFDDGAARSSSLVARFTSDLDLF